MSWVSENGRIRAKRLRESLLAVTPEQIFQWHDEACESQKSWGRMITKLETEELFFTLGLRSPNFFIINSWNCHDFAPPFPPHDPEHPRLSDCGPSCPLVSPHASFSSFRPILCMATGVIFPKCKSNHVIPCPSFLLFYCGGFKTKSRILFFPLWIWAGLCDSRGEKNVAKWHHMASEGLLEEVIPLPLGSPSWDTRPWPPPWCSEEAWVTWRSCVEMFSLAARIHAIPSFLRVTPLAYKFWPIPAQNNLLLTLIPRNPTSFLSWLPNLRCPVTHGVFFLAH